VVAPEQSADLDKRSVGGDLRAGVAGHVARYVGEDLAPPIVDAQHAGCAVEAHPLEVAQQNMDGRRPRTGAAPHGVTDLRQGTERAGQDFLWDG
jgi:hypothetical protein